MAVLTSHDLPLVSEAVLRQLQFELEDQGLCLDYVRSYVNMWGCRFQRLTSAVVLADHEAAMDAVLSLKSSSLMVGASRLGHLAGCMEQDIRWHRDPEAASALSPIGECGNETMTLLRREYLRGRG